MNAELVEKIGEKFPDLLPVEVESEAQRKKFLVDFFMKYLKEFGVDIENLLHEQIQEPAISCGDKSIPKLMKIMIAVNRIIPNFNLTIFHLLSPDIRVLVSKVKSALCFFEFCDEGFAKMYDMCAPYEQMRERIAQLKLQKEESKETIKRNTVKIQLRKQFIEQAKTEAAESEQRAHEYATKKMQLGVQLQQLAARKTIALRKKTQLSAKLSEVKSKIASVQDDMLNSSGTCKEKFEKLDAELKTVTEKKQQLQAKKEESQAELAECLKLKQLAVERTNTAQQILDTITKAKELESKIQEAKEKKDDDIAKQEQENEKLKLSAAKRIALLEKKLKNQKSIYDSKQTKLEAIKNELKDVHSAETKLQHLDAFAVEMLQNYQKASDNIKSQKEKIMKGAKGRLDKNNVIFEVTKALERASTSKSSGASTS